MIDEYELGKDEEENTKKLTKVIATEYMQQIRGFTNEVVSKCSNIDEATGKRVISTNDRRFEIMLSMEKDKFYLKTGFKVEQISAFLKKIEMENEPSAEERLAMFEKIRAQLSTQAESNKKQIEEVQESASPSKGAKVEEV